VASNGLRCRKRWTASVATGIEHYLRLVQDGRNRLKGMLTHPPPGTVGGEAFTALATQEESGALKVAFDFR